jgi:uncharacterized protein
MTWLPTAHEPRIPQLLVKVASRCNIDCSYCYWFRDRSVYKKPKLMSEAVFAQLLERVEEHVSRQDLPNFSIILHGGEPLLWGIANFRRMAEEYRTISERTGCAIALSVTTNGVLIDEAWADCFETHDIAVTVSIDGPAHIHNIHRRTFQGGPTHALVERAIHLLQSRQIPLGILAVCNPRYQAREFFEYFTGLGITDFDLLFPDATFEDEPPHIAQFYCELFDLWLDANRDQRTVNISTIEAMVAGLLGGQSNSEAIGYGPEEICTVMTDGSMEPLDVLRIAGDGSTSTTFNIFDNAIADIMLEPRWKAARDASLNLCDKCRRCEFMQACGGGYLPHRFSKQNGYANPSVYCDDLIAIFNYMQSVLSRHVFISKPGGERVNISDTIADPHYKTGRSAPMAG